MFAMTPHLDLIAPQDSMGAQGNSFANVSTFLTDLAAASQTHGRRMWSNVELFEVWCVWRCAELLLKPSPTLTLVPLRTANGHAQEAIQTRDFHAPAPAFEFDLGSRSFSSILLVFCLISSEMECTRPCRSTFTRSNVFRLSTAPP
jgi:hypothetical protein